MRDEGLGVYVKIINENEVDVASLISYGEDDLISLGITNEADRKKMLDFSKKIRSEIKRGGKRK